MKVSGSRSNHLCILFLKGSAKTSNRWTADYAEWLLPSIFDRVWHPVVIFSDWMPAAVNRVGLSSESVSAVGTDTPSEDMHSSSPTCSVLGSELSGRNDCPS